MRAKKFTPLRSNERVDYSEYYQLLIKRRFELLKRDERDRSLIDQQDTNGGAPGDMVDRSEIDNSGDYYLRLADKDRQELVDIRDALEKLHHSEYGYCENCEQEISSERLRSIPQARLCIQCQSEKENRRRIGVIGSL